MIKLFAQRRRAQGLRKAAQGLGVDVLQAIGPADALPLAELHRRLADIQPGYETWTAEELTTALRTIRVRVTPVRGGGRTTPGVRRSAAERAIGGAR